MAEVPLNSLGSRMSQPSTGCHFWSYDLCNTIHQDEVPDDEADEDDAPDEDGPMDDDNEARG